MVIKNMNTMEHLLVCGAEEAGEVALAALELQKRFCKSLRFGNHAVNPETDITGIDHLITELNDLEAVVELLVESGVNMIGLHDRGAISAKKAKIRACMQVAIKNGVLLGE